MKRVPPKTGSPRASPRARLDAGVNPLRVSAGLIFFLAAPVFARGMPIFWAPAGLLRVARAAHRGLERPSHLPGGRGGHLRRQSALPRLLYRVPAWEPAGLRATSPLHYRLGGSRSVFRLRDGGRSRGGSRTDGLQRGSKPLTLTRSRANLPAVLSSMVGTAYQFNNSDECCRLPFSRCARTINLIFLSR